MERAQVDDDRAMNVALFETIDSNNDAGLSPAEFEIGLNILKILQDQNYPGMKNPELDLVHSSEDSKQSLSFSTLGADDDGALSPTEFSVVIDRFL